MKIININGRRQNSCNCGTWLDHWVKICGRPLPNHCSAKSCLEKAELGAHVQKDDPYDTNWYIVPLCVKHSIRASALEVVDSTSFASALVSDTCGKLLPIANVRPQEHRVTIATSALAHAADRTVLELFDSGHFQFQQRIVPRTTPKRLDKNQGL